jgi:integral membrane protein
LSKEAPARITDEENPAQAVDAPGVRGALARYRVLAYIVGVGLLALVAAMVLKYAFDVTGPVAVVGPVHGFLYAVYMVVAFDLALKARWSVKGTLWVLLAGMIPFVSFVVERSVSRKVRAGEKV